MSYVFAGCMSLIVSTMLGCQMGKSDEKNRLRYKCLIEQSEQNRSDAVDYCNHRVE